MTIMAQESTAFGFPPEGKIVEASVGDGIVKASHTRGRWHDEHGRPVSVKGWRYIHAAEPEPKEAKVKTTRSRSAYMSRRPADSKSDE